MIDLHRLKDALAANAELVCQHLFPEGKVEGGYFKVGDITGKPGKSLTIYLHGPRSGVFNDYAAGEAVKGSNLLELWRQVRSIDFKEACQEAQEWLGRGFATPSIRRSSNRRKGPSKTAPPHMLPALKQMAAPTADQWREGADHARSDRGRRSLQAIDSWRGWIAGTAEVLVDDDLLSLPLLWGERGVAFAVQAPIARGWIQAGFHYRRKPKPSKRPSWGYDPKGIPSLPFVLGSGYFPTARLVIVLEGQWDAIAFASTAGWMAADTSWPEDVAIVGIRGAPRWQRLLDYWQPFWPQSARFLIIPDNDEAGLAWKDAFAPALAARSKAVIWLPPKQTDTDFSDIVKRLTPAVPEIDNLLSTLNSLTKCLS